MNNLNANKKSRIVKDAETLYSIINKKPLPDWMLNHQVFKKIPKLNKVFPKIGLHNFKEEVEINTSLETNSFARDLLNDISFILSEASQKLYKKAMEFYSERVINYEENIKKYNYIISIVSIINSVCYQTGYDTCVNLDNNKITLRLPNNIVYPDSYPDLKLKGKVIFKSGEPFFRILPKINELIKDYDIELSSIEKTNSFKEFSKNNFNNKKYELVFSSSGEDGIWDISTISMRGIKSCQAWDTIQSRGLIGSVSSKFVGVIYITSGRDINGMGSKMLKRSLVRFVINKSTKKPTIIVDKMYPSEDKNVLDIFKKSLANKSKLNVHYSMEINPNDYYLPTEENLKYLNHGESSYMDVRINVKSNISSENNDEYAFKQKYDTLVNSIHGHVRKKLEDLQKNHKISKKENKEYSCEVKKASFNVIRYILRHNFITEIVNALILKTTKPETKYFCNVEEYYKSCLTNIVRDIKFYDKKVYKSLSFNDCMKKFPVSYKKVFLFISKCVRQYCIDEIKNIIKIKYAKK